MKVLFISIVPSPYQRDLFAALNAQAGIDLSVRYVEASSPDSPWPAASPEPYEKVYKSIWVSWGGKRFIINRQLPDINTYDIIVLNGYNNFPSQFVLRFCHFRKPLIFWGEKLMEERRGIYGLIRRSLLSPLGKISAIVAIGKEAERDYKIRYKGTKIYQLPYYCDLSAFTSDIPQRPRKEICLLFCGQMIERKGIDILLDAFEDLINEGHRLKLLLIGREADLQKYLANLSENTKECIRYEGFIAPSKLPEYFRQADIFVLPSRYDGWGVVVNQAIGAGLPIICSDAVGSAETLIEVGKNGYIFQKGNVQELKNVLLKLISEPDKIHSFSQRSREISQSLHPDVGAQQWIEILNKTIERHHANTIC